MPFTRKAHNFFEAVSHGMVPRNGSKLSQADAARMAKEGIKKDEGKRAGQRKALEGI